ncbi:hypothetical protein GSI_13087 [Ganoderma sinense ZZ0214-1]|uniref:Uncharacterized protein n=1 Tax=Ganoderma sinense ZZ0214-1 TaxID=1077348 RepID=A0A2G8RV38_9APHY|nr:hypothetical protein GSI_13087 [Ganoderma sinense ZZ0214-1]
MTCGTSSGLGRSLYIVSPKFYLVKAYTSQDRQKLRHTSAACIQHSRDSLIPPRALHAAVAVSVAFAA